MEVFLTILFLLALGGGAVYLLRDAVQRVPTGHIGVQHRHFGRRQAREFALVAVYGAPGPQAEVLRANTFYFRPRFLYRIDHVSQTYIPLGTIGVVEAKVGAVPPPGTRVASFVACDHFQDGVAFLRNGGQQGRQLQVLGSGRYDINPHIFDVITVDNLADHPDVGLTPDDLREIKINVGETGVVITRLGTAPQPNSTGLGRPVPGHNSFQYPWVFLNGGGELGVQSEALHEGGYYFINPWFANVVKIPTRNLIMEWTKDAKAVSNLDASLEQIELDVQGYNVRLEMKQTLRIPAGAAPGLVRKFGEVGRGSTLKTPVQQFVEKELSATVTSYFRKISASYTIFDFITKYDELGTALFREIRQELAQHGIEAVATTLDGYECEPQDMNELRRAIAIQNEQYKLEEAKLAALEAELVNTGVYTQIENQKLVVEAERRKLELIQIQGLVDLLGPEQVAMERILAELVKMGVPQVIASGGSGEMAQALLQVMPFSQARDMMLALAQGAGKRLSGTDEHRAIESQGESTAEE
jgi:SPFH domain / Band 7 family